jgi:hypothetical protein
MRWRGRHAAHVAKRHDLGGRLLQVEIQHVQLGLLGRLRLPLFQLLVRQEQPGAELSRPLERDAHHVGAGPDTLQIRVAPRCTRRAVGSRSPLRLRRLRHYRGRRRHDPTRRYRDPNCPACHHPSSRRLWAEAGPALPARKLYATGVRPRLDSGLFPEGFMGIRAVCCGTSAHHENALAALIAVLPLTLVAASGTINHPTGTDGVFMVDKLGAHARWFDALTLQERANLPLPTNPHDFVFSPDHTRAYVPIYGPGIYNRNPDPKHHIYVIDVVKRRWRA